ncbi:MAG: Na/Pi cotransporter family protein [Algiphilus sp.]
MLSVSGFIGGFGLLLLGLMQTSSALRALLAAPLHRHLLMRNGSGQAALLAGLFSAPLRASLPAAVVGTRHSGPGVTGLSAAMRLMAAAALATTLAGWGLAIIALDPSLSPVLLPGVAVGALLMLSRNAKWAQGGRLLAGLVLALLGTELLFGAVPSVAGYGTLDAVLVDHALITAPLLALLGFVLAGAMRSSVAIVAVGLAALSVDALSLLQTAALSIGCYAALVLPAITALGAAPGVGRRIAAGQLLLHGVALVIGFACLYGLSLVDQHLVAMGVDVLLVAAGFASVYWLLSLMVVMLVARVVSVRSQRHITEDQRPRLRPLEPSLYVVPAWALDAAVIVLRQTVADLFGLLVRPLRQTGEAGTRDIAGGREALEAVEAYLERLGPVDMPEDTRRMMRMRQALDHARSLCDDLEAVRRAQAIRDLVALQRLAADLGVVLEQCAAGLVSDGGLPQSAYTALEQNMQRLATVERGARPAILEQVAGYQVGIEAALAQLGAQRWLERVAVHALRTAHHLRDLADSAHPSSTH